MNRHNQQTIKVHWMENTSHRRAAGGYLGKGRGEIVDPGANEEVVFKSGQPDSQSDGPPTQNDSPLMGRFLSTAKKLVTGINTVAFDLIGLKNSQ